MSDAAPQPPTDKPWWQSKKLLMTIAGIVTVVIPLLADMIPKESRIWGVLGILGAVSAYVIAQGKVDAAK